MLLGLGAGLYSAGVLVALFPLLWHAVPEEVAARRCRGWPGWLLAWIRARWSRSAPGARGDGAPVDQPVDAPLALLPAWPLWQDCDAPWAPG